MDETEKERKQEGGKSKYKYVEIFDERKSRLYKYEEVGKTLARKLENGKTLDIDVSKRERDEESKVNTKREKV